MEKDLKDTSFSELIDKGQKFYENKEYKEAIKIYKIAMLMYLKSIDNNQLAGMYIRLANAYYNLSNKDKSTYYYEEYLKLQPQGQSSVFSRLSHAYYYTDTDKCIDYHNKALNLQINTYDVASKLFAMTKSSYYDQQDIKDESEYEISILKNTLYKNIKKYTHEDKKKNPNKKLKIGYLSSDCYSHTMMNYLVPLWENHNQEEFDFYLFRGSDKRDSVSEKIEKIGFKIIECVNKHDAELAKLIYDNGIDIIIDAGGYTHLKSLSFLYKPAPVIITYLGYLNTLGIPEVDYILTDRYTIPEDKAYLYTEKPLYLDRGYTIYNERKFPEIQECPYKKNGYITYGSYNCPSKFSDSILYIWSEILKRDTTAKLLIYRTQLTKSMIKVIKDRFKKLGIEDDRLMILNKSENPYFKSYSLCDISLDPYPFSGMSIALEAALMGIPSITLAGECMQSRGAGRINKVIGLEELLNASTGEEYIEKALALANNKEKLEELRKTLRDKIENSDIRKGMKAFAEDVELKYKQAWENFIKSP